MSRVPYGSVLTELAERDPERIALVCGEEAISCGDLEARANRLAWAFESVGVRANDFVSLVIPNGIELVSAMLASWKLGAVPNPLAPGMPTAELERILARANPRLIVGGETGLAETASGLRTPRPKHLPANYVPGPSFSSAPPTERVAPHERALASGGSTGLPKLILPKSEAIYDSELQPVFARVRRVALVPGPLHHAAPFSACFQPLFAGRKVVLMKRFDARLCLELIERHRVDRITVVPTMMLRILRLPESERLAYDLSSLECVMSGGAPLPAWLMEAWIDWLGPDVMNEVYGPSERIGGTAIGGRAWLEHRGSVGQPVGGARIKILDDSGRQLPAGEMGEIWMMPASGPGSTYRYRGAEPRLDAEGWESVGDMGYLDAEGYLYLGDRKSDMILSGGQNIYPAEVEAALESHPRIHSSAVIGLPDDDLGQRLHAIVEVVGGVVEGVARVEGVAGVEGIEGVAHVEGIEGVQDELGNPTLSLEEVREWLAPRLVGYKHPRSLELVDRSLRDEAGKLRRSRLREERLAAKPD